MKITRLLNKINTSNWWNICYIIKQTLWKFYWVSHGNNEISQTRNGIVKTGNRHKTKTEIYGTEKTLSFTENPQKCLSRKVFQGLRWLIVKK